MKRIVFFLLFVILLFIETVAHAQYGLLLSSFRDKEKAVTYAETLGVIKKNVFIEKSEMVGSGTWYRVCLGPFDSRGEALTYRNSRSDDIGSEKYALVVDINKQAIVPFDETSQKLITNVRQELTFDAEKNERDRADIAGEDTTTISSSGNDDQDQNEEELPEEFFGILYASFRTEELARQEAERIHKKLKDDAYVEQVTMRTSGQWFRVCIGPYMERQKAGQVRERLIKEKEIKSQNTVVTTALSRLVFRAKDESEHENMGAEAKSVEVSGNGKNDQVTKADGDDSEERKVVITWDRVSGKDVTGYKLYYGTVPGPPYEPPKEDYIAEGPPPIRVGNDMTQKELHGLNPDKNYYFAITAVDGDGNESDYSSEIVLESGHVKKVVQHEKQSDERSVSTKVAINKSPMVTKRPPDRTYRRYPVRKRYPIVKKDDSRVEKSREASHTGTIAPGDILFISIPGQKEMTRRYDVDPDGNIYMLIVGKLPVGGKSETEATKLLEQVAQTLVTEKDKNIDLRIVERKRYIQIAGGVRYPGWYRMDNETTLDEIVRMAGGMIPGADKNKGTLLRQVGNEHKEVKIDRAMTLSPNDIFEFAMPQDYQETADAGDTLFISIPQRQAPGRMQDRVDSADLTAEIAQNKIDVDVNGFIHLPSYGHIYVNGLTADEIKEEITRRLPRYIAELKRVEVGIVEKKHHIQVMGHVEEPGEYVVPESANIQQAVSLAGGITDGAVMSDCVIQRSTDGQRKHLKVNLYQYTITGDIRLLTPLHSGDIFFVPITPSFGNVKRTLMAWQPPEEKLEKDIKSKVKIIGAVNNPGIYDLLEDMNLLDLMVLASGDSDMAELSDILIIRDGKVAVKYNMENYLNKFHEGVKPLPKIMSGDTVYVSRIETTIREARERIYIIGNVLGPGSYELYDNMTVLQALSWAGGLNEWADRSHITIVRMIDGEQQNIDFSFDDAVSGREPAKNIRMQANDIIVVH